MNPRLRQLGGRGLIVGVFVILTAIMTWPQARHMVDQAVPHQDVYFNIWRLEWFAHALVTRASVLDGNIFYPEHRTLTLSDAMFVEGSAAAPLFWMGLPPVLVHNMLLLGAIALSGAAMFALVRYLTGSRGAGLLAGMIFAFAPYRFDHFMHMELQWTMWMPLAFLALHRALDTGGIGRGLLVGLMVSLQMLSSIYYGVFLTTLVTICGVLLLIADRRTSLRVAVVPLLAGAALAAVICTAYAIPYLQTRDAVGERSEDQIVALSARPSSYLVATPTNWLYGRMFQARGRGERRLFPGLLAVLLAVVGLLLRTPSARVIVYLLALILAFEMSLGLSGYAYRFFHEYAVVYRGLRAPARLGIFVVMFLAVLAGYGYASIAQTLPVAHRRLVLASLSAVLILEYHVRLDLTTYPNSATEVYRYLAQQPRGVVAEFPVPRVDALPGPDGEYAYMSTFHWFPLVNGYSGVYPASYLARLERLRSFPSSTSLMQLHHDGVRYVILHGKAYRPDTLAQIDAELQRAQGIRQLGVFDDGSAPAYLYQLR
jgi:hypothetical protein